MSHAASAPCRLTGLAAPAAGAASGLGAGTAGLCAVPVLALASTPESSVITGLTLPADGRIVARGFVSAPEGNTP
ncbi:MAG: hypothetical protein Q4P36_03760 [Bowdeniella nasicola]|nr:hypothetical protein [Bowdeniella nasicola]